MRILFPHDTLRERCDGRQPSGVLGLLGSAPAQAPTPTSHRALPLPADGRWPGVAWNGAVGASGLAARVSYWLLRAPQGGLGHLILLLLI